MKEKISSGLLKLGLLFKQLSLREQVVAGVLVLYVVGWLGYQAAGATASVFSDQTERMNKLNRQLARLPQLVQAYRHLEKRRDDIEKSYKESVIEEGAIEHIESLLKSKDRIDQKSIRIEPKTGRRFGGNFEQLPYQVTFKAQDFPQLVELLNELDNGKVPLRLLRVGMKKLRGGSQLSVQLDVSSVRRVQS